MKSLLGTLLLSLALCCGCTSKPVPRATEKTIGVATMRSDRTLVLQLRIEGPGNSLGETLLTYPPTHPEYAKILQHVGPLVPGRSVFVHPWPDNE